MGYKQLYIKNAKKICFEYDSIKIIQEDKEILVPLEDLSSILLEDPYTVITSYLLAKLAEFSVSLTVCNERYMPTAQVLPLNTYYNQVKIYKLQTTISPIINNRLWQKIVKQKIINQAKVIQFTTEDEETYTYLIEQAKIVKSNDNDNREGICARFYFNKIFGKDFIRFGDNSISSALNYGYSLLHSTIVKRLVCAGFNTNIGIWHKSEKNAYNLASDIIEAFRPIIDYYVYWNESRIGYPLDKEVRREMINLLNKKVLIDDKQCKIEYAIEIAVGSYQNVLEKGDVGLLKLPEIIEVNMFGE